MTAADYTAGVRADVEHVPLGSTPQPTPWDPELGQVMAATGRAVYEETVADPLIEDLLADRGGPSGDVRRSQATVVPASQRHGLSPMA